MDKETHKKLVKRHDSLKSIGKVTSAVQEAGISWETYNKAIKGSDTVLHKTLIKILTAQQLIIDKSSKELLSV